MPDLIVYARARLAICGIHDVPAKSFVAWVCVLYAVRGHEVDLMPHRGPVVMN